MIKVVSDKGTPELLLTHTENISVGGVCVTLRKEMERFTSVEAEIDLLDGSNHVRVKGKVVWVVRRKQTESIKPMFYDIGVEFVGMPEVDKKRLQVAIDYLVKNGAKVLKPFY